MVPCHEFSAAVSAAGISFYTGVPDSLLKDVCAYFSDTVPDTNHIIAANEGGAVALAAGHHLATGSYGLVYLQNSGLGNCVNPLLSLADADVYSIPMLLMIGWRGEPGVKDEPQHRKQGKVTLAMLDSLSIPYVIIDRDTRNVADVIAPIVTMMKSELRPVAIVVREGAFEKYRLKKDIHTAYPFVREEALHLLLEALNGPNDIIISTTGKTSREIFEYREQKGEHHGRDFLTVGSMGHASQIALGIAMARPSKRIFCLDGDGAALMHLGAMAIVGTSTASNYFHIVLNNGAHDSVGGQPTVGHQVDLCAVARSVGYRHALSVSTASEIDSALNTTLTMSGPIFIEIRVNKGARENLGRPTTTTYENKQEFMSFISQ